MDTGSCNMWVNSRFCESGCSKNLTEAPRYDERKSKSYGFYDFVDNFHYGSGSTYGYASWDDVCMSNDTCMPNHTFMNVGMSTHMEGMSGLIGFCPIQGTYFAEYSLMMDSMYKYGHIEEKVFSIWVNHK